MSMDNYRPARLRIFSHITQRQILHVEDALEINKIVLDAYTYARNQGSSQHCTCYIDADDARLLAHQLITGSLVEPWTDYKGSVNRKTGEVIARVLTIEPTEGTKIAGYRISCAQGPGSRMDSGAVKPAGKLDKISVLLPARDALKMALALAEHLQAWTILSYWNRKNETWKPEEEKENGNQ